MRISKLVKTLEDRQKLHGDIQVYLEGEHPLKEVVEVKHLQTYYEPQSRLVIHAVDSKNI